MSEILNISVSKICRFSDYLQEKWGLDQEKMIAYLQGKEEKTFEKSFGTAFHSMLERPEIYAESVAKGQPVVIDGITISNSAAAKGLAVSMAIEKPCVREAWVTKEITLHDGTVVNLRGKVDVLNAYRIEDYKTTGTKPSYEKYCDGLQHQLYMWMADVPSFRYQVFFIKDEELSIIEHDSYDVEYEPAIEPRLIDVVGSFVDFITLQGLLPNWNQLVSSQRQATLL